MAVNLNPYDRLQPCLLDRLTDDRPARKYESREEQIVSLARMKDGIRRDLSWLLNTKSCSDASIVHEFPEVAKSTVNYGLRDFTGGYLKSVNPERLKRLIYQAVLTYEPRIIRGSLSIDFEEGAESYVRKQSRLPIIISARVWAQPVPMEFFARSEFDLETENIQFF